MLCKTFFGFLVFYLFANHFHIQTNSVHAIPPGPKMITPIGLFLEMPIFIQYP